LEEGPGNEASLFTGALLGGVRKALEMAPVSIETALGNLGEGSYYGDLCVIECSGTGVSPYRGPVGEPGQRNLSIANFEN
jgi:hypothetical protein